MKSIYIAGKITGECETPELLEKCKEKFNRVAFNLLETRGNEIEYIYNPFIINAALILSGHGSWKEYMKNDLSCLIHCDEAHFLPDWKWSRGACIEHQLCLDLEIKIEYV